MKTVAIVIFGLLLAEPSDASWLLWQKTVTTRQLRSAPPSALPQVTINEWNLLNAVDTRSDCTAALREDFKRSYESLNLSYPGGKVNQSPVGEGIHATLWTGSDSVYKPMNEPIRIGVQYDFWCLPAGVDPRSTQIKLD